MTVHFQRPAAQQHYDLRMTPVPVTEHGYPDLNLTPKLYGLACMGFSYANFVNIRSWTRCVIGATGIIGTTPESFDGVTGLADIEVQDV